jgi:hypothetical protein
MIVRARPDYRNFSPSPWRGEGGFRTLAFPTALPPGRLDTVPTTFTLPDQDFAMTRLLRLSLIAFALGAPLPLAASAGAADRASAPFEGVAAARDGTQARAARRHRRPTAQSARRHRQAAQRTRRARATQG